MSYRLVVAVAAVAFALASPAPGQVTEPGAAVAIAVRPAFETKEAPRLRLTLVGASAERGQMSLSHELEALESEVRVPTGNWTLTCDDDAYWCKATGVEIGAGDASLTLPVFRRARFVGRLASASGGATPSRLAVQGRVPAGSGGASDSDVVSTTFETAVEVDEAGFFTFDGPAARMDLRLASEENAPIYFWDVGSPDESAVDLGTSRLRRGGSLSGFVLDEDDGRQVEGARVEVTMATVAGSSTPDRDRLAGFVTTAETNAHGFFQVTGLQPGNYDVTVKAGGGAEATLPLIGVLADDETHLPEVVLRPLATVLITLEPPTHPAEGDWRVSLEPVDGGRRGSPTPEVLVAREGVVELRGVRPGTHRLKVFLEAAGRQVFHDDEIDLVDGATPLVEIPLVEVRGAVTYREEPVLGRLRLQTGSRDGLDVETDDDGRFRAWMRTPEKQVLFVDVDGVVPSLSRRLALRGVRPRDGVLELDLALTGQGLRGRVFDAAGDPAPGADVLVRRGEEPAGNTTSDETGEFELLALDEAPHTIWARHTSLGTSELREVDLSATSDDAWIELRLARHESFTGRVVDADGTPVPQASITLSTLGPSPTTVTQDTDVEGRYRFFLHPETTAAMAQVAAPSHGTWFGCVGLASADEDATTWTLPPVGRGTLELRVLWDASLPPTFGLSETIYSSFAGFLDSADYHRLARLGLAELEVDEAAGVATWTIRDVYAGAYAVAVAGVPTWQLAREVCTAGPPPTLEWTTLNAGGTATLEVDVRPFQEAQTGGDEP